MGYMDYSPLIEKLNKSGLSTYSLYTYFGVARNAIQKVLTEKNPRLLTHTLTRLCGILECQPGDLMRYVPTEEDKEIAQKKYDVIQRRSHFRAVQFHMSGETDAR